MSTYADHLKIKDALQIYFSKYHFANGGYDLKWFKIKLGPVFLPFPNTKDRIAAVKIHDIHHVITGYNADYRGEAEIAGWEIASGCGYYYVAWILNSGSFFYGMLIFPGYLYRAFMLGRKCKTNIYHNFAYDDHLLNKTIGELKSDIYKSNHMNSSVKDNIFFAAYCLFICCLAFLFFYGICLFTEWLW